MKVLVTGGAGFIGSHIVDELIAQNHDVRIFDALVPQVHKAVPPHLNKNAEFVQGDVRDKAALSAAIEDVEVIIHDAAEVGVGQSMYEIERYVNANVRGTAVLLDLLVNKEHDVKKLIVASSMSIYGEGKYECDNCGAVLPKIRETKDMEAGNFEMRCPVCRRFVRPIPTDEDKPLDSTSVYALTKKDQEEYVHCVGKAYGIPTVALRYFNVYGPRQSLSNPYTGVAAIFSSRIKNNNPPVIFEDGLQSRDFVNVKDIVQGNILAMTKQKANYDSFNVASGKVTTILEVAKTLIRLMGASVKPETTKTFRKGDIRHCFADISKIKKIGYEPSVKFEDGMRELVNWGKTVEATDDFDRAFSELKNHGLD